MYHHYNDYENHMTSTTMSFRLVRPSFSSSVCGLPSMSISFFATAQLRQCVTIQPRYYYIMGSYTMQSFNRFLIRCAPMYLHKWISRSAMISMEKETKMRWNWIELNRVRVYWQTDAQWWSTMASVFMSEWFKKSILKLHLVPEQQTNFLTKKHEWQMPWEAFEFIYFFRIHAFNSLAMHPTVAFQWISSILHGIWFVKMLAIICP